MKRHYNPRHRAQIPTIESGEFVKGRKDLQSPKAGLEGLRKAISAAAGQAVLEVVRYRGPHDIIEVETMRYIVRYHSKKKENQRWHCNVSRERITWTYRRRGLK